MVTYGTSPKQDKAIQALLDGKTNHEAAEAAGVDERTIYRWKQEAAFQMAIIQGQSHLEVEALLLLGRQQESALSSMFDLAQKATDESVRLRASKEILDQWRDRYKDLDKSSPM